MTALLYIQSGGTLLVQSQHEDYDVARPTLLCFSDLIQRLDPIHVYQLRSITLWQAASLGLTPRQVLSFLRTHAAHPTPYPVQQQIVREMGKWGQLTLQQGGQNRIVLRGDPAVLRVIRVIPWVMQRRQEEQMDGLVFSSADRAELKRVLTVQGYPVLDRIGYRSAPSIRFSLLPATILRDYQLEAVEQFFGQSREQSGVAVLPCGAGKTLVGMGVLERLQMHALILTPNETSAQQWRRELLQRTTLEETDVSLYSVKHPLSPITITTYQRVAAKSRSGERRHLSLLTNYPWGIVVYDEVHMLPAPLFRLAADLQSARRFGLTATLVREDGLEREVFSLIGPKCYEVPWKKLEDAGYLAAVRCVEVRVPPSTESDAEYDQALIRERHRIAAGNPNKALVARRLVTQHAGEHVLILGHYLDLLQTIASELDVPLLTGKTPQAEREYWFSQFRRGNLHVLVLSRIANMAVDLPSASVAIQVSGLFGSRQEEAQRLGRLLRPKTQEGVFYTLVTPNTIEQKMASHRQLYLLEQGYAYDIVDAEHVFSERVTAREVVGMLKRR